MITVKEIKKLLEELPDEAVVGIEGSDLIARHPNAFGWEEVIEVGQLDPVDDED